MSQVFKSFVFLLVDINLVPSPSRAVTGDVTRWPPRGRVFTFSPRSATRSDLPCATLCLDCFRFTGPFFVLLS